MVDVDEQYIEQRRVGKDPIGLETAPLEHGEALIYGAGNRLSHQPRFTDTRLASDSNTVPGSAACRCQCVLKRIDLTARTFYALVTPGSAFAGSLFELAIAADRSYMLADPEGSTAIALSPLNGGLLPMSTGLSRLEARFFGQSDRVAALLAHEGPFPAEDALAAGLVTFAPDDIDWEDEVRLAVEDFPWSSDYYLKHGYYIPEGGLARLQSFDAIFFGAVGAPSVPDHVSLWGLRLPICQGFDQYANVRPARILPGIASPLRGGEAIDWVIVRENSEG